MNTMATFLYARPSFCGGLATAIDIGGTLVEYNRSMSPEQADAIATLIDWYFVGEDVRAGMNQMAETLAGATSGRAAQHHPGFGSSNSTS